MTPPPEPLKVDDLRRPGAPATLTVKQTARILKGAGQGGVSSDCLYEAIARGEAPWPILRIGRRILIPVAPLMRSLGLEPEDSAGCREVES